MMLSERSGWLQSDYLSLIKMFPICGNMLLETDELAQSRVSTWECSKFNKAIQAGGKEFFRFFYFKDALASLCVIFSKLRKMSLYTLDIARSDHRVMPEGFVFINLSFGKPCNFVIQLFNPAICHLINLKKKFHLSIFYLSAFNLPASHFLLLFRRMMTQKILQPDFYIHCSTASSYV